MKNTILLIIAIMLTGCDHYIESVEQNCLSRGNSATECAKLWE